MKEEYKNVSLMCFMMKFKFYNNFSCIENKLNDFTCM